MRRAFTLIELLIVVSIIGIMAMIVIPRFSDASRDAKDSAQRAQLSELRRQIELYKLEHDGALPDLTTAGWSPLTQRHTFKGKPVGPYLPSEPKNAYNGLRTLMDGTAAATPGAPVGYVYDYASGAGTGIIRATVQDGTTIFGH